jgi:hypothetical protein
MNDLKFTTAGDYMKKNERIRELLEQVGVKYVTMPDDTVYEKFAELIVRECIDKIETHRIPVGNSAAGEMACEWTYAALKEIRDEIKEHFGVEE